MEEVELISALCKLKSNEFFLDKFRSDKDLLKYPNIKALLQLSFNDVNYSKELVINELNNLK